MVDKKNYWVFNCDKLTNYYMVSIYRTLIKENFNYEDLKYLYMAIIFTVIYEVICTKYYNLDFRIL